MPTPHAYNDLGQIISSGGIDSGARELSESGDPGLLIGWIAARWPGLSPADAVRLQDLIIQASDAAGEYSFGIAGSGPELSDIPIAPTVLGADPEGNRFEVGYDVTYEDPTTGEDKKIYVKGHFPTLPSIEQLATLAEEYIESLYEMYPERFQRPEDSPAINYVDIEPKSITRIY